MLEAPLDAAQELESSGNLAEVPGSDGTGRSDRRQVLKQNPVCLIHRRTSPCLSCTLRREDRQPTEFEHFKFLHQQRKRPCYGESTLNLASSKSKVISLAHSSIKQLQHSVIKFVVVARACSKGTLCNILWTSPLVFSPIIAFRLVHE